MESLDLVYQIVLIVLFVLLSAACIYLIVALRRMTASIKNVEDNLDKISTKLSPVLDNAAVVSSNMKDITSGIKTQVDKLDSVVDSVRDTAESIIEFEQRTQRQLEGHVFDILNLISAISKGVKSFLTTLKGTNGLPRRIKSYSPPDSEEEDF